MNLSRIMSNAILRASALPKSGPYPTLDPFLFCVYHKDAYPADVTGKGEFVHRGNGADFDPNADYRMYHGDHIPGFPQHPHRGFETITATIDGIVDHADSLGNAGRYGEGDVQWMTAGKGIVHDEMFPLLDKPNHTRFFQIWLNLPRQAKMVSPSFAMFWANDVPIWKAEDGLAKVTVWAGHYFGIGEGEQNKPPPDSWATDVENDVGVLHIEVQPGGKMVLPKANNSKSNRSLYLIEGADGQVKVDDKIVSEKVCLTLDATKDVSIELPATAKEATEFLVLQGKPIDEPVVQHGPFVMNTQSEIRDAFMDYQRTQFGGWPWPRDDMVFPKDKGRFALVDGKETYPDGGKKSEDEL